MNHYQIAAFAKRIKKENMNKNFINDPNEYLTDRLNDDSLINQYFDLIKVYDYSHMFSDDNKIWERGIQSEKRIKELLHALINVCRMDAEQLLEDSIYEVKEGYTNGLTHLTIRNWFKDYVSEPYNINVKPYTKEAFKYNDGMYYVGNEFDVDGDGWVSEEQLELLLLEYKNGVK